MIIVIDNTSPQFKQYLRLISRNTRSKMIARTIDIPQTQKAIVAGPDRNFTTVHDQPVTDLDANAILIKVHAVALNLVDTKLTGDFVTPGAIFGFDCAGTVVAVGSAVRKHWTIGERVCGSACGMDPERPSGGAFAEYTLLPGELALRIPDYMSFETATTLPTAINTTVLAIFWSMNIPMSLIDKPAEKSFPILVYGGSTSVGTMVIQILKRYVAFSNVYQRSTNCDTGLVSDRSRLARPRTSSLSSPSAPKPSSTTTRRLAEEISRSTPRMPWDTLSTVSPRIRA